jgi:hypothetical protein
VPSLSLALTGGAEAQHFQLTLPPNLELTEVDLRAWRPFDFVRPHVCDEPEPEPLYSQFVRGFDTRTHLYLRGSREVACGSFQVGIRAEREGILTGSVIAAALIALVLVGYWRLADHIFNIGSSAATAALLLTPGFLIAAYLVRAGEHAMVRRLLVFPRAVLALSGGLTLVAAATLQVLAPESKPTISAPLRAHVVEQIPPRYTAPHDLKMALGVMAAVACVLLLLLIGSHFLPRRGKLPAGNYAPRSSRS